MTLRSIAVSVVLLSFSACGPGVSSDDNVKPVDDDKKDSGRGGGSSEPGPTTASGVNQAKRLAEKQEGVRAQARLFDTTLIPSLIQELVAVARAAGSTSPVTEGTASVDASDLWKYQSSQPHSELVVHTPSGRHTWQQLVVTGNLFEPNFPRCAGCSMRARVVSDGLSFTVNVTRSAWTIEGTTPSATGPVSFEFEARREHVQTTCASSTSWEVDSWIGNDRSSVTGNFTELVGVCSCNCFANIAAISSRTEQLTVRDGNTTWDLAANDGWVRRVNEQGQRLIWNGDVHRNGELTGAFIAPVVIPGSEVSTFARRLRIGTDVFEYGSEVARNDSEVRSE